MKKIILTLTILLFAIALMAQISVPNAFNYQAVVRNAEGEIIANQNVTFRFSILKDTDSGDPVYIETHPAVTNDFGLVNLTIGTGTTIAGNLDPGNWSLSEHFLKIEIDASGGDSFSTLGTSKLQSVPYAFHAQTVAEDMVEDADADTANELQELSISNDTIYLTPDGGHVKLPSSGVGGDNWGTQTVETDAALEGDGTASFPLDLAQQGATSGQTLLWNGSAWLPGDISNSETSPWEQSGSNIFYNEGKVGIGTAAPSYPLSVEGDPHGLLGISGAQDAVLYLSKGSTDKSATLAFMDVDFHKFWVGMHLNNHFQISSTFGSLTGLEVTSDGDAKISGNQFVGGNMTINGKMGIGTAEPAYDLDIAGSLNLNKGIASGGKALYVNGSEALWYNGNYFSWGYGANFNLFAKPVGIKTSILSDYELVVNGEAAKTGGGDWSNPSDIRLKDVLGNYTKGLNDILRLQPIRFKYKVDNPRKLPSDEEQIGFIAQKVQEVFPEAVNHCADGYLDFNMHSVNVALVNAVKELKAENDRLKVEIVRMKTEYESRLSGLENLISGYTEK